MDGVERNFDDLIWEAVRRNEIYISEYNFLNENEDGLKIADPGFNCDWLTKKAFDPAVTIDDILEKIENGASPIETHPYWGFYNNKSVPIRKIRVPVITVRDLQRLRKGDTSFFDDNKWVMDWIHALTVNNSNRMIVSVDPYATDDELARNIAVIKRDFLDSPNEYVVSRNRTFSKLPGVTSKNMEESAKGYHLFGEPENKFGRRHESQIIELQSSKLKFCFEYLARYDQVVETIIKKYNFVCVEKEYVILPNDFDIKDAIPRGEFIIKKKEAEKRKGAKSDPAVRAEDNLVKQYKKGYKESVRMIKAAPAHIRFLREDR